MDEEAKSRSEQLKYFQALPLDEKVSMSLWRIREFLAKEDAYISFSGGKDSTVLAHLVHQVDPTVPLVFSNTGLEYQAIQSFAKRMGAEFVRPKMRFDEVISKYGYPIISKEVADAIYYARRIHSQSRQVEKGGKTIHQKRKEIQGLRAITTDRCGVWQGTRRQPLLGNYRSSGVEEIPSVYNKKKWLPFVEAPFSISGYCCSIMKKKPSKDYGERTGRYPFVGTLAEESRLRKQTWIKRGCNSFDGKIESMPLSFWTNQDILHYIKREGIEICSVYGDLFFSDPDGNDGPYSMDFDAPLHCTGCQRTGCVYCMFGAHSRDDSRFLELQKISPRQYEYAFGGGQWVDNPHYDPTAPEYDGEWKNWNPKKIWVPSKQGLGLKFVIDQFNEMYPNNKIKY